MEESKYLRLARQARAEDNSEDAKNYYGKVREEDPENGEAKFFYAYFSLYEGTNGELPTRFANLFKVVNGAVRMIKESNEDESEKLKILSDIVNAITPEVWAENKYMNSKNHETKVGDKFVQVFSGSDIVAACKIGMFGLRDLGDEIIKQFGDNPEVQKIAIIPWKEYIALSQKWYSYAIKGEPEAYAEKVKKIDPSYVMPEKAKCISFANKK